MRYPLKILTLAGLGMMFSQSATALGVTAGTDITNTATASYTVGVTPLTATSNTTSTIVDELLNVTVVGQDAGSQVTVSSGAIAQVQTYVVTNTGNGTDSYSFTASNQTGDDFDTDALRDYLRSCLPRAMVPADIHLLDELPLTPSGKLDINALPASLPAATDTEFVAARNETEAAIAAIWAEALGLERVGVHDDFFALRGHSLLAIKVIARTGESLGIELPLQSMFETPTVAGVAQAIEALRWTLSSDKAQPVAGEDREVLRL